MALPVLLCDALRSTASGFSLALSLPWIRSLPVAGLADVSVWIDDEPAPVRVSRETGWWFVQDRLELVGDAMLSPGAHDVAVSFRLVVPYLQAGPDGPLTLPFRADAALVLDAPAPEAPAQAVTVRENGPAPQSAEAWDLGASAFNWTPEIIRAARAADDIVAGIVTSGVSASIEIEPGQLWRSFPTLADDEVDAFRSRLAAAGGAVTILGGSLDDWELPTRRRTTEERAAFLVPQLRAAARVGARGVRVPFGQTGPELLRRLQPVLDDLGVVLYEEIQGQQTLDVPANAEHLALLDDLADPHVRVLIDISMLMPSLPPSYLDELRRGGLDPALVERLEHDWRSPDTHGAVIAALRGGAVPPAVHTLFMNLLVRFGRSSVEDLEPLLPLTAGVHLKFWDLDDTDGRVSQPIADIGAALRRSGFSGTLTSEWGGHEWLDDDPAAMTLAHLDLARTALPQSVAAL